jgi:hypothetical protein
LSPSLPPLVEPLFTDAELVPDHVDIEAFRLIVVKYLVLLLSTKVHPLKPRFSLVSVVMREQGGVETA